MLPPSSRLRELPRDELEQFVADDLAVMSEQEALSVLENPYATPRLITKIAQNLRLTGFYSVRLRLVSLRQTPQAHAVKLVHYLHWPDLVRLSVDVTVSAQVRRTIETVLLTRIDKLSLGERISSAKRCSAALIRVFLFDPDPKVFAALLLNQRLREDDLLLLASSSHAHTEQLTLLAADRKWSSRYTIRKALVLNPSTPRSIAASQLRFLSRRDRIQIHSNPSTSTYIRRCIERLSDDFALPRGSD